MSPKPRSIPEGSTPSAPASPAPSGWRRGIRPWIALPALAVVTVLAYQKVWSAGFVWDDDAHLIRPELASLHGLWLIWTEPGATQQYYPLLSSAFWVERRLWGYAPLGYHVANVLLHVVVAGLFYAVLRRLQVRGALLATVLFALHPACVESVAWISEQKNTLSGAFYFAAALAYLRFDAGRRGRWYAAATALFALALMSKTVTATLPASLLVVFWWKRGMLSWKRDIVPLIPWFGMSAAAGAVTVWVEHHLVGAGEFALSPIGRVLVAGRAVWFYLGKALWPSDLAFIYPRWVVDARDPVQYLYPLAAAAVLALLFAVRGRWRAPFAAALLFIGALSPALGFVDAYPFRFSFVADHFQYLALPVILAAAAATVALLLARAPRATVAAAVVAAAAGGVFLARQTDRQCAMYRDVGTLWQVTIARNPDCWMAHNNLGLALAEDGQVAEAEAQYREALRIYPRFAGAHTNLGLALLAQDHDAMAEAELRRSLDLEPNDVETHNDLGIALRKLGRMDEALAEYRSALQIRPDDVETHFNLGNALLQAGRVDEAIARYQRTIVISPEFADAHNNLGNAYWRSGRIDAAAAEYRRALEIEPGHARARANLDKILAQGAR